MLLCILARGVGGVLWQWQRGVGEEGGGDSKRGRWDVDGGGGDSKRGWGGAVEGSRDSKLGHQDESGGGWAR